MSVRPAPLLLPYRDQRPRVAPTAWVAPGASLIGDVEIGPEASIWFGCVVRGDVHFVRIGERSNVQDGTVIHVTHTGIPALIGREVMIGHGSVIHACTLSDGCFVGMGAPGGSDRRNGADCVCHRLGHPRLLVSRGAMGGFEKREPD